MLLPLRMIKFIVIFLSCFSATFCGAVPMSRPKKSSLSPLTAQQLSEVVRKLKATNGLNCAFIFDLKTTKNKKTEMKERKIYSRQNSDGINLRFNFGDRAFLLSRSSNDEIFSSEKLINMKVDTPLLPEHLLSFADIVMPFLEGNCECRHSKRVQGRNTHIIRFKGTGRIIDIAYDPAFEVILQVEYFDEKEKLLRTFKLLNFKKIQNTWLMKSIEIKDISADTTTQLIIKKVAVEQTIPENIFDKNSLEKPDTLSYVGF
jgi:hypothetical protein